MPRSFLSLLLILVGCGGRPAPPPDARGLSGAPLGPPAPARPPTSPPVYRLVGDFDGDGRDDYAVGEACGVHGMCPFEVLRNVGAGQYAPVGSVAATYDDVGLCPGDPPRLVTVVRHGTQYDRVEYVVGPDSVRVVRADTSSLEGGGPPDSWRTRECADGLEFYESTEAEVTTRGDSSWRPLTFAF